MMTLHDQLIVTVVDKLLVGLALLAAGYYVNKALEMHRNAQAIRKEGDVLRDKEALRHLQRQIEELYSPLLCLISYYCTVYELYQEEKRHVHDKDALDRLERYFKERCFLPINAQIAEVIRSKIYLVATPDMPKSFYDLLEHEATFATLDGLWKERNITSEQIPGKPWPASIENDVSKTLDELRARYNETLSRVSTLPRT